MNKFRLSFAFFTIITISILILPKEFVFGQAQTGNFSGSDINSYQCFDANNRPIEPTTRTNASGQFLCPCKDGTNPNVFGRCSGETKCENPDDTSRPGEPGDKGCLAAIATLKPPTLQILEVWFVRILYIIWAIVGSLSFFYLVVLGYRWMLTRGDVTKITEIRQKIIYYIIGVALVFLAVPILTTVFRLLGINDNVDCYNVEMPAFQFFFADLCTAPNLAYYCENPDKFQTGLACQVQGQTGLCNNLTNGVITSGTFYCPPRGEQTWIMLVTPSLPTP